MTSFTGIALKSLCALSLLAAPAASQAAKAPKVKKIKLDTMKPGKIVLDPRLGYILVRMGPKDDVKDRPLPVALVRIDPATGTFFTPEAADAMPDFWRTQAVGVNTGRSFGDKDGVGVYVVSAYPGRWVVNNVGPTCLSLGTYAFDVKQGEITDVGTFLTAREDGESSAPELAGAKLSQDLIDFGVAVNIVMSEALAVKPAPNGATAPAPFASLPLTRAELAPDFRFENRCAHLISRAASLPPLGHQPPMTRDEAATAIAAMNPPVKEKKEAAKK